MSKTKNIRSRHNKSNPVDFILNKDDVQSNEKNNDIHLIVRNKYNKIQIILMILTTLFYLCHTLRAYIPSTNSHFLMKLVIRRITRVYTSDLRPNIVIESLLFRLAGNWQTFWLIYILSYISRRSIDRYLNIFNSYLCLLLISALLFQTISQSSLSSAISCVCLCISLILLIITCRIVAIKSYLLKNKSTNLSIDLLIIRYFILNSLFFYTIIIAYSTMCATVEYIGIYLDSNVILLNSTSICTTIGLLIIFFILLIYFLFDRCIYENEFWSIWTPYLFIAYIFICLPLHQLSLLEYDLISNNFNYYLFWVLFCLTILLIILRFYRQISILCRQKKKKIRISSDIEQFTREIN